MPDPPDTSRDWLRGVGEGKGRWWRERWSSWIVLEWAVVREVSQLCPERDAPTNQGFAPVSASGSPFASRRSRYSQGAPPTSFLPTFLQRLYLARVRRRARASGLIRVHYAPAFERSRNARHEAFAVSGNISTGGNRKRYHCQAAVSRLV